MILNITKEDAVFAFIQARINSKRLSGKVLKQLSGKTLLQWSVERAKCIYPFVEVVVLTGDTKENDIIIEWCISHNIKYYRGSENNVLNRYTEAASSFNANTVIRLTADNPLFDYLNAQGLLAIHLLGKADYSSNKSEVGSGLPIGIGVEIFSVKTLVKLNSMVLSDSHREHISDYILENSKQFRCFWVNIPTNFSSHSFTIDTPEDYKRIQEIMKNHSLETINKSDYWTYVISYP